MKLDHHDIGGLTAMQGSKAHIKINGTRKKHEQHTKTSQERSSPGRMAWPTAAMPSSTLDDYKETNLLDKELTRADRLADGGDAVAVEGALFGAQRAPLRL